MKSYLGVDVLKGVDDLNGQRERGLVAERILAWNDKEIVLEEDSEAFNENTWSLHNTQSNLRIKFWSKKKPSVFDDDILSFKLKWVPMPRRL